VTLVAVPNVSEGRDEVIVSRLTRAVSESGARVADVHSDSVHNRSVITAAGEPGALVEAMAALAVAASAIDLTVHRGVHPRLGGLDVCPFVADDTPVADVVAVARGAAEEIARRAAVPVYLYGLAATRPECVRLPDLRRGGLTRLAERSLAELPPDFGPRAVDPRRGVVCVGARGVLIAFNVWLRCEVGAAREIARATSSVLGPSGVRALGLDVGGGLAQVSMNLTRPEVAGIDRAFGIVAASASRAGVPIEGTEIVGVPPQRYLPDPDAQAARLLMKPGRSLEAALAA
jgi:glutamate formiminotransferase